MPNGPEATQLSARANSARADPARGPLLAIGGAEDKLGRRTVLSEFVALAGGDGRPDRGDPDRLVARARDRRGLRRPLPQARRRARSSAARPETREEAEDPDLVARLERGHRHLHDRRQPAQALRRSSTAPRSARPSRPPTQRGVVVAGTSAGASIQSSHMVAFGSGRLHPQAADDPARRRPRADPRRRDRPALRPAQPLRPAADAGRAEPATCSASGSTRTPAPLITDVDGHEILRVLGRGVVTVFDGRNVVSNAHEARRTAPLLASGVVLHVLPAGSVFDLTDKALVREAPEVDPAEAEELAVAGRDLRAVGPRHRRRRRLAHRAETSPCPAARRRRVRENDRAALATDRRDPPPTWRSWRRGSTAVPTCGPTTRRSTSWSTSARSRTSPPTRCPASPTSSCRCFPGCASTPAPAGRRGGFVERLNEGTWLGHVAEHAALALQQVVGHDIRRGKTRQVKGTARALQHRLRLRRRAGRPRRRPARRTPGQPPGRGATRSSTGTRSSRRSSCAPSAPRSVRPPRRSSTRPSPATSRGSGSTSTRWCSSGQGVHQKRIRATMTSATSAIAVDVASDKDLTTRLLGAAGLPVPKQESVRTADQAVTVAQPDRLPRRGQAARRQPRPRRLPGPAERRRRTRGVPDRQGPVPARLGDRRVLHHRPRLPLPDHRRHGSPPSPSGCPRTWSATGRPPSSSWSS